MAETDYFFYLSFENSLCKDYITEKFFNPMGKHVIPIVLGGAPNGPNNRSDYTDGLGAPYHSFIDARQYSSPGELAKYLNMLYSTPQLYAEYFWWKDHYNIMPYYNVGPHFRQKNYCDICRRLHEEPGTVKGNQKVIKNLREFWEGKSRCQRVII